MKQRRYTEEEKRAIVNTFLERRRAEGISLRWYACESGIPYYTLRDMYRDSRYNSEWMNRYSYSTQDNNKVSAEKERANRKEDNNPILFVRLN